MTAFFMGQDNHLGRRASFSSSHCSTDLLFRPLEISCHQGGGVMSSRGFKQRLGSMHGGGGGGGAGGVTPNVTNTSTRRFRLLPSIVALFAVGSVSPGLGSTTISTRSMKLFRRLWRAVLIASARLSPSCALYFSSPVLSVWPINRITLIGWSVFQLELTCQAR